MENNAKYKQMDLSHAPFYDFFTFYTYSEKIPIASQWHKEFEILFCTKGEHKLSIDGEDYHLKKRDIVIINSNASHFHISKPEGELRSLSVSMDFLVSNGLRGRGGIFKTLLQDEKLWEIFKKFYVIYYSAQPYREAKLRTVVLDMLIYAYENYYIENEGWSEHSRMNEIMEYLNVNYAEKVTLDSLSREFNYSKCYLSASFKKYVGKTIIEYVNYNRCIYAESLLKTTNLKFSEIAEMSGFGSVSNFRKRYKEIRGRAPSDIRNRHRDLKNHLGLGHSKFEEDFGE